MGLLKSGSFYYGLGSTFVLSLGSDLVLRALERGARVVESGPNDFQGRYSVRHPWTGPMACERPERGVWRGPPNGRDKGRPKPAISAAYALRGNVQLASFLRPGRSELRELARLSDHP